MTKLKDMTAKQLRARRILYGLSSYMLTVIPTSAVIISRWDIYTQEKGGFKLGAGGVLLGIVLLLAFLGKMKVPGRVFALGFAFVTAYLLEAVLHDMVLLLGVAFASVAVDALWTGRMVKKVAKEQELREAADRASKATVEGIKEYLGQVGQGGTT